VCSSDLEPSSQNISNVNEMIADIKNLVQNIDEFCVDTKNYISIINAKYNVFIELYSNIKNDKIIVKQLINSKNKYNPNAESIQVLNNYFERLNKLEDFIHKDYDKIDSKQYYKELGDISNELKQLIIESYNDVVLHSYCEQLYMYLNRFRTSVDGINDFLDHIEKLITDKKIEESLDRLIDCGMTIKNSRDLEGV
jgi:hypothetical protein